MPVASVGKNPEWTALFSSILYTDKHDFGKQRKEQKSGKRWVIYILSESKGVLKNKIVPIIKACYAFTQFFKPCFLQAFRGNVSLRAES